MKCLSEIWIVGEPSPRFSSLHPFENLIRITHFIYIKAKKEVDPTPSFLLFHIISDISVSGVRVRKEENKKKTMKIPTTHLKPILISTYSCNSDTIHNDNKRDGEKCGSGEIKNIENIEVGNVCGGGIEYKGKLYTSHAQSYDMVFSPEELWFIAKVLEQKNVANHLGLKEVKEITYLSKIWATKKMIKCSYSEEVEKAIRACHEVLYCL